MFGPATKGRPFIDFRRWAVRSTFTGTEVGPVYTVQGRGGQIVARQMNVLQGAMLYQPKLPVQSITAGLKVAGTYGTQPLAVPAQNNG